MNVSVLFIIYSATCPDTVCVERVGNADGSQHWGHKTAFETASLAPWAKLFTHAPLPSPHHKSTPQLGLGSRKLRDWRFQMSLSVQMCP